MSGSRVLVVDSDPGVRWACRRALEGTRGTGARDDRPLEVVAVSDLAAAREAVEASLAEGRPYAVMVLDLALDADGEGLVAVERLVAADRDLLVVLTTANPEIPYRRVRAVTPATHRLVFLRKPFDGQELRHLVQALVVRWQAERALAGDPRAADPGRDVLETEGWRYLRASRSAGQGVWEWEAPHQLRLSEEARAIIGDDKLARINDSLAFLRLVHPEDREATRAVLEEHVRGGAAQVRVEFRIQHPRGDWRWVELRGSAFRDGDGRVTQMVGTFQDVTERKLVEERLARDALHDPVTGLLNRSVFTERVRTAIALARRKPEQKYAVLFLDLDRFKLVNDSLGHLAGDALLKEVANRLDGCLRSTDATCRFGTRPSMARFGGDEFTVLLEGIHGAEDAVRVARRVLQVLARPVLLDGRETFPSASIGVVLGNASYERPEQVLRDADAALYQAKSSGRGRYVLFDEQMHARAVEALELEAELRRAVERREFRLLYQPIVSLASSEIVSLEALIRWERPGRGLVSPAVFLPTAEETGLVAPIGEWALREACERARRWQDVWPERLLSVAVNLSSRQFADVDFVALVRQVLLDTGLRPSRLKLEITEGVVLDNQVSMEPVLKRLRALGVELHLDDFGTGFSALSHLRRYPFEDLKIDGSFIKGVAVEPRDTEVVRTLVKLAHDLGMEVTAEGVETRAQIAELKFCGCDRAQGYAFSPPLLPEEAEALVAEGHRW